MMVEFRHCCEKLFSMIRKLADLRLEMVQGSRYINVSIFGHIEGGWIPAQGEVLASASFLLSSF